MRRVVLTALVILASVSVSEAREKAMGCSVVVEIKDKVKVNTDGTTENHAEIDRVWTKTKTKCESKGKVKFYLINSSDIDVTVFLKHFQAKAGGVCTGKPSGTDVDIPLEGPGVRDLKLTADAQGDDKAAKKIRDLGTGVIACYKFDVYLYKKSNTNQHIHYLDPDLEIGPPSGPPPGTKGRE